MGYLSIRQTAEKWTFRQDGSVIFVNPDEFPEQRKSVHTGRFQRMRKSQLTQELRVVAT